MVTIRLFNKYQASLNNHLYAYLVEEDFEEDNLKQLIGIFGIWLANAAIQRYHKENFELRNSMIGKYVEYVKFDAKNKYFEHLKSVMKYKFKNHVDWKNEKEW